MPNVNNFFDRLFNLVPGYYFGILTFSIGFLNICIALVLSPNYVMWVESVSSLGQSEGGIFLRIGLILSMLFAIPFIIYLGRRLKDEEVNNDLRTSAVSTGIFSSITIILTSTFLGGNTFISSLHGLFTLLSWLGIIVFFILLNSLMLNSLKVSRFQILLGFTVTAICVFFLILVLLTNFCNLSTGKCYPFGRILYIMAPTIEWITTFSIFLWFLGNSCDLLYREKDKS